jgi:hypothetical protein
VLIDSRAIVDDDAEDEDDCSFTSAGGLAIIFFMPAMWLRRCFGVETRG